MYCSKCGNEIDDEAVICVHCGCQVKQISDKDGKNWLVSILLCLFLGGLGIHRFYTGYTFIGIIQLLTAGGCGIWWLIDLISILCNVYKTADGQPLQK